jgi:hypothetical protein
MSTALSFYVNTVNGAVARVTTPADFMLVDLTNDYLIWSATLASLMTHQPTALELNAAASVIDPATTVTVARCLLMDYSAQGGYYTRLINGMGGNYQYVFNFSFDGATATEPQLEAWDTSSHTTAALNVLGSGTNNDSFVKAKCTTSTPPGGGWAGTPLAGANVVLLNDGNGALGTVPSGLTANDLYANLKIVIPANYSTPASETFVLTVRYTYA